MSKFSQELTMSPEYRRRLKQMPLARVTDWQRVPHVEGMSAAIQQHCYNMGIELNIRVWLDDQVHAEIAKRAQDQARSALIYEVFGEFHQPLQRALYHLEFGEAKEGIELVQSVFDSMFGDVK